MCNCICQDASSVSTTTHGVSQEDSSPSMKSRLGPIPPASMMQLNNLIKKSTQSPTITTDTSPTSTQPEQVRDALRAALCVYLE